MIFPHVLPERCPICHSKAYPTTTIYDGPKVYEAERTYNCGCRYKSKVYKSDEDRVYFGATSMDELDYLESCPRAHQVAETLRAELRLIGIDKVAWDIEVEEQDRRFEEWAKEHAPQRA